MIRNAAALLHALQQKEMEVIARSGITHAPTIGAQYEGLTSSLVGLMIPEELNLQVVTGFVEGRDGTLSKQIDCMLVTGEGTPIPHVAGAFRWPVQYVLAVFEVKKTLFGEDLTEAHDQLQSVMDKFWGYAESLTQEDGIDVSVADYVYGQIVGEPPPGPGEFEQLALHKQAILHYLRNEQIAPVRVVFGYYGYQNETTLREGFLDFLRRNATRPGFAGIALPTLIVCGQNVIIKENGHPYYFPLRGDQMLCFASSSSHPLIWLINVLLTRTAYICSAPEWYNRELSLERFAPLLWGKAEEEGEAVGWVYNEVRLGQRDLESVPALSADDWRPVTISDLQAAILAIIGNDGILKRDLLRAFGEEESAETILAAVADLMDKRLVSWKADRLVFLTRRCATAITGWGEIVAADMEDGRLFEWIQQRSREPASNRGV